MHMMSKLSLPCVDPELAARIDAVNFDDLRGKSDGIYALRHELVLYGCDAVAHALFITLLETRKELKDLIRDLKLQFAKSADADGLKVPLSSLQKEGLYIPQYRHTYTSDLLEKERKKELGAHISLFQCDYHNRMEERSVEMHDETFDVPFNYPDELTRRYWRPYDLENPFLLSLIRQFAGDLWQASEIGVERDIQGKEGDLVELAKELRDYHRSVMTACGFQLPASSF